MGQVFLMTDKTPTKDVPCTYPTCPNACRVTKFYSAKKARCPDHGGVSIGIVKGVDGSVEVHERPITVVEEVEAPPLHDNRSLGKLHCPVCPDSPLEILAITEEGHIDFGCQDCWTVVSISFNWNPAQIRSIPDRLAPLVQEFNIRQVGTMDAAVARKLADSFRTGSP